MIIRTLCELGNVRCSVRTVLIRSRNKRDVRNYDESAGAPQVGAEEDLPPEVVGAPQGAFQCSRGWRSHASLRSVPGGAATRTPPVLVSLRGTRTCLASTYPILIGEVPLACWHTSVQASGWGGIPCKLYVF